MERQQLQHNQDKTFCRLLDINKTQKGIYIFSRNDKDYIEKLKQYAIKNDLDILYFPNITKLSKEKYQRYYKGGDVSITGNEVYRMDTLFIDIDLPLYDNYYKIRTALKGMGINNYQVFESASGNVHLYIKVKRFNRIEDYKVLVKTIGKYLESKGIEIDKASENPIQKTYLEGFRILSKGKLSSKYIKELSHKGQPQTKLEILRELNQRGIKPQKEYSCKYAMYIIQKELENKQSGVLQLTQLEKRYLIPKYTLSRGLKALREFKAIDYHTIKGQTGYIKVFFYAKNVFDDCIKQQRTRKENYFLINVFEVLKVIRNLYLHLVHECCKYIEKSVDTFESFVSRIITGGYVQGLLSGNSGSLEVQEYSKNPNQTIPIGQRNQTLYKTLVKARYQGASDSQLMELASDIYSNMEQTASRPFTKREVQSVYKWSIRVLLNNSIGTKKLL